jgi:hypothetical protein
MLPASRERIAMKNLTLIGCVLTGILASSPASADSGLFALLEARKVAKNVFMASLCGIKLPPAYIAAADKKMVVGMGENIKEEMDAIVRQSWNDWVGWPEPEQRRRCKALTF